MQLQKSGDLKLKGLAFTSFFHVPENGRFQKNTAPESGQKKSPLIYYWLEFVTRLYLYKLEL